MDNQEAFPAYLTTYWPLMEFMRLYGRLVKCDEYVKKRNPNEFYYKCVFLNSAGTTEAYLMKGLPYSTLRDLYANAAKLRVGMFQSTNNFIIFDSSWPARVSFDASFSDLIQKKNGKDPVQE